MSYLPPNPNVGVEFDESSLKEIYLAGGCYWGAEAFLERIYGVYKTEVGFANGKTLTPSYEDVCKRNTGHAETVYVVYDESKITLSVLIDEFFRIIDPTSYNKQGGDEGSQYRTGIYYATEEEKLVAEGKIKEYQPKFEKPILVEVEPLENYYPAEESHQKYLEKNPNGYCHVDLSILDEK